jgi:hypothetical protein
MIKIRRNTTSAMEILKQKKPTFYNCHCGSKMVMNAKKGVICNSFENGDRIMQMTSENAYICEQNC